MGKMEVLMGKPIGKQWENGGFNGKTIGKLWEKPCLLGFKWGFHGVSWD